MEDFMDLVLARHSCRSYSTRPVEEEKLRACLEAGRLAPSASNRQPWRFVVADTPGAAAGVARAAQAQGENRFTAGCPVFIAITEEGERPDLAPIGKVKRQDYRPLDIGIAVAHICLMAQEQGLASCILGWYDEGAVREALGIPPGREVRVMIALGYAAEGETPPQKKRKPFDEAVRYVR